MEIQQRPALFSPVGGLLANPVKYRIATATAFVSATVQSNGSTLGRLKASARTGVVTLDISSILRSHLNLDTRSLPFSCTFTDGDGATVADTANLRYAVLAALPYGSTDYAPYAATGYGHEAQFATLFDQPVLFEGHPLTLTIAVGNLHTQYLEREYVDASGNILLRRSDLVTEKYTLADFDIEQPQKPEGTHHINVRTTNEYRPYAPVEEPLPEGFYLIDADGTPISATPHLTYIKVA